MPLQASFYWTQNPGVDRLSVLPHDCHLCATVKRFRILRASMAGTLHGGWMVIGFVLGEKKMI